MNKTNSEETVSSIVQEIIAARAKQKTTPAIPLEVDEATAQCLAALAGEGGPELLPGEAFAELRSRNDKMLTAPKTEIRAALTRQACVMEATNLRFLSLCARAKSVDHATSYAKIGLAAGKSLVGVLAALHSMAVNDEEACDGGVLFEHEN
ncbi:MAG: hypothetical protein V5B36_11800 [Candidatus Accumulibacter sp. UW25]|jgi:hypothetical protein